MIRKIVLFSALLFCSLTIKADCSNTGILTWPSGNTIKKNSIIVIDFYAESQKIVSQLRSKYPVYLKAGKEKIFLNIVQICYGEFNLTQVILKPNKSLNTGVEYELVIGSLPADQRQLQRWNTTTKIYEPVKWTVEDNNDFSAPEWIQRPAFTNNTIQYYGCGPAKYINYDFKCNDESAVLIKATVKSLRSGKETTYYTKAVDGKIKLGFGMCSGAFKFTDGDEFEVVFALMDASGNTSCNNPPPYKFTRPGKE